MSRRPVSASAYDYVLMSVMSLQDCSLVVKYVRLCKEGGHHLCENYVTAEHYLHVVYSDF